MKIEFRNIELNDAIAVSELSRQLGYQISVEKTIENINEIKVSKDHCALVAIYEKQIAGWIHAFKSVLLESNVLVEIGGLVVDENFRNRGIGKILLKEIIAWSLSQNIHEIRVRSNIIRKDTHRFYLKNGFDEIKEQKVFNLKF